LLELERRCSITANTIDSLYNRIVDILTFSADTAVPKCKNNFFKFWWDSDMDELKEKLLPRISFARMPINNVLA